MPILQCRADCWTMNTAGGTSTTCQDCGKVFSEANAFKRHFRQYHKKSESDCHICERKFYTEFLLKHHIGLQHTNANCEICDKVVLKSSLNAHKKHTRRMHSSVNHVIKSTIGKTTWKITGRLVEDL